MSWLHVEESYIDLRQSFDSSVHQNTENFSLLVNGRGRSTGHPFISFHTDNAKGVALKYGWNLRLKGSPWEQLWLLPVCCFLCYSHATDTVAYIYLSAVFFAFLFPFHMHYWRRAFHFFCVLRYPLTLFLHARLAAQSQSGYSDGWVHVHTVTGTGSALE